MKISSLMIPNPITITEKISIKEAIEVMKKNSIRHLPVIADDNVLKGFVTLADLKLGLIPSLIGNFALKDLMIRNPITVNPDDDIEKVAKIIYKHKIGGMPVVKDKKLVGIITETDILRTFIEMMGFLEETERIDIVIGDKASEFKKVLQIIYENKADIISVGIVAQQSKKKVYYFRLSNCDINKIKYALTNAGFELIES